MQEFHIILRSLRQVQDFVTLAMAQPFDISVGNDSQQINGKDFMGMLSLDYSLPVSVWARCTQEEFSAFRSSAAQYIV